jgi:hypothetical protein
VTPPSKDSTEKDSTQTSAFSGLMADGLFWRYTRTSSSADTTQKKQPTNLGHIGIAGAMLIGFLIAHHGLGAYISGLQESWLTVGQVSETKDSKLKVQDIIEKANIAGITPAQKGRLIQQFTDIQSLEARYLQMTRYFGEEYFVATVMKYISGLIAVVCAFFISRDGWEKANNSLINIFFISSIALTYYTDSVGIFRHEANFQTSLDLYLKCISTKNMVLSYYSRTQGKQTDSIDQFIASIDTKIDELDKFKWGLNGNLDPSFNSQINRVLKPSGDKGAESPKL